MTPTFNPIYAFLLDLPPQRNPYPQSDRAIWKHIQFTSEHNYPLAMEQARQFGSQLAQEDMSNEQ